MQGLGTFYNRPLQIVGFTDNKDPNKVPRISETPTCVPWERAQCKSLASKHLCGGEVGLCGNAALGSIL